MSGSNDEVGVTIVIHITDTLHLVAKFRRRRRTRVTPDRGGNQAIGGPSEQVDGSRTIGTPFKSPNQDASIAVPEDISRPRNSMAEGGIDYRSVNGLSLGMRSGITVSVLPVSLAIGGR